MTNQSPTNTDTPERLCFKCKAKDHELLDGFDDNMKPRMTHFVRPDPYPLEKGQTGLSAMEKAAGFFVKVIDGKAAKYRWICNDCYAKQEETKEYRRSMQNDFQRRKENKELKDSFYVQEFMLNG